MDELVQEFLAHHPHLCAWLFMVIVPPLIHLYANVLTLHKILHTRRGDFFFMQGPRGNRLERLLIWLHLAKPVHVRHKHRPPLVDDDKTPV